MSVDSELHVLVGVKMSTWSLAETCEVVNAEDVVVWAKVIGS